jgi:hypothetical protein
LLQFVFFQAKMPKKLAIPSDSRDSNKSRKLMRLAGQVPPSGDRGVPAGSRETAAEFRERRNRERREKRAADPRPTLRFVWGSTTKLGDSGEHNALIDMNVILEKIRRRVFEDLRAVNCDSSLICIVEPKRRSKAKTPDYVVFQDGAAEPASSCLRDFHGEEGFFFPEHKALWAGDLKTSQTERVPELLKEDLELYRDCVGFCGFLVAEWVALPAGWVGNKQAGEFVMQDVEPKNHDIDEFPIRFKARKEATL